MVYFSSLGSGFIVPLSSRTTETINFKSYLMKINSGPDSLRLHLLAPVLLCYFDGSIVSFIKCPSCFPGVLRDIIKYLVLTV